MYVFSVVYGNTVIHLGIYWSIMVRIMAIFENSIERNYNTNTGKVSSTEPLGGITDSSLWNMLEWPIQLCTRTYNSL